MALDKDRNAKAAVVLQNTAWYLLILISRLISILDTRDGQSTQIFATEVCRVDLTLPHGRQAIYLGLPNIAPHQVPGIDLAPRSTAEMLLSPYVSTVRQKVRGSTVPIFTPRASGSGKGNADHPTLLSSHQPLTGLILTSHQYFRTVDLQYFQKDSTPGGRTLGDSYWKIATAWGLSCRTSSLG
jgi:hypothetical protein